MQFHSKSQKSRFANGLVFFALSCTSYHSEAAKGTLGLVAIHKEVTNQRVFVNANAGYFTVYKKSLSVVKGQILRIHTQIESTDDTPYTTTMCARILVGGVGSGYIPCENNDLYGAHHLPLWVDTTYTVPNSGTLLVESQIQAQRGDANPQMTVESGGYGHLIIEQYEAVDPQKMATQLALIARGKSSTSLASAYGSPAFSPVAVNSLSFAAKAGDVVRLSGQTQSQFNSYDMHASAIYSLQGNVYSVISSYATQDQTWDTYHVPNWVNTSENVSADRTAQYFTRMHSSLGTYNPINTSASQLIGLQFRPIAKAAADSPKLLASSTQNMSLLVSSVLANSAQNTLIQSSISLAKGDVLRLKSFAEPLQPLRNKSHFSCVTQIYLSLNGILVSASSSSYKYVNYVSQSTPLYNDDVYQASADGNYEAQLKLTCDGGRASIRLGGASIIADVYGTQ